MDQNRQFGVYYTSLFNVFDNPVFLDWIAKNNLAKEKVLEPFAGSNSIIEMLQELGLARQFTSYDINPQHNQITQRDTLKEYPKGYKLCITNPPWLYKSSAIRRGLKYPQTMHDNLYKYALELALQNNQYVAMLIPASYINSGIFFDRLSNFIFINKPLFEFTDNPVCLALFNKSPSADFNIYSDNKLINTYNALLQHIPPKNNLEITFNDPKGDLGLIAIDNTKAPTIRFCRGVELKQYDIKTTSRSITRISIQNISATDNLIHHLNNRLMHFRELTDDIFLTAFKGLRADGKYRRRLDYSLANRLIGSCCNA